MRKILLSLSVTSLFTACQVENINYTKPIVLTYEPKNVLGTSATVGGIVLGEGGQNVSEYGFVYSTTETPTVEDNKVKLGERIGEFIESTEVFEQGKTYSLRAYATNEIGTAYGETYTIRTSSPPPCSHTVNNFVDLGKLITLQINSVETGNGLTGSTDGNVDFITQTNSSTASVVLSFNEEDQKMPLTGMYTVVPFFDSLDPLSDGKVQVYIQDFNSAFGGDKVITGTEIFVENNDGNITFIFCDAKCDTFYEIDGKFTYNK